MKKTGIFLGVLTVLFSSTAIASKDVKQLGSTIPLRVLFETPSLYDGKEVIVKGEVVGDIMRDGKSFWINIEDEGFFIGIVINAFQKEKIKYTGRYKIKGDVVKISGVYHLHCPLHSGERDIHAEQFEIIESGYKIPEVIESKRVIGSILLVIITIFLLIYSNRKSIHKYTDGQQK
ncbi:MAG: hypothetical protein NC905_03200 [Candidatus Omnitrophica bacterium]|nr:hypothetical protein [Candidatus Omnitrophota bacterium]MCM8777255.1 hypothetical protein [Candidatus Omnitrophota bacterium]